ncbi:MAG: hypothetical protein P8Y97_22340 [Candidatus Lokiarchaeota archaeon]
MTMEDNNIKDEKKKISVGLIISKEQLYSNPIIPEEIKEEITEAEYYLLIYISREDVVKISCFPTKTDNLKKILIKLEEFSPNLVKGISSVLRELNLSKDILHTTGLCFKLQDCYYESYLVGDNLKPDVIENVKQKFKSVTKIVDVIIEDIEKL